VVQEVVRHPPQQTEAILCLVLLALRLLVAVQAGIKMAQMEHQEVLVEGALAVVAHPPVVVALALLDKEALEVQEQVRLTTVVAVVAAHLVVVVVPLQVVMLALVEQELRPPSLVLQ